MKNYTNQFVRVLAVAVCGISVGAVACTSENHGSSSHRATACADGSGEYGCDDDGGSGSDGSGGSGGDGSCEYGSGEYGCDDDDDDDCDPEYGGPGCDDDDDCTPVTTPLADLIASLTELDCSTSTETLDAIVAELRRLALAIDCSGDVSGYCDDDLAALVAAISQLQSLPIAFDCPSEIQDRLDEIIFTGGRLASCGDTEIDNGGDGDGDGDGDDDDDDPVCATVDWDRMSPAPNIGGDCSVIALTGNTGYWDTVADLDPSAFRPGASPASFSTWERGYNDYGAPLVPASDLLSKFGLSTSQIGFVQSIPGTHQLYTALDLRPHQFQLMSAPRIVVMYGRTNAAAAYVDEGEPPLAPTLDPGAYAEYLYLLDYEHSPRRDSIKVLSCDARELIGKRALTFSSRFAIEQPWTPYVPARPGVWAAVLSCQAPSTTPTTPTIPTSPTNHGSIP